MENRIVHGRLSLAPAIGQHLFIADATGGRVVSELLLSAGEVSGDVVVFYVQSGDNAAAMVEATAALPYPVSVNSYPTVASFLTHMHGFMSRVRTRVQIYVAGSEALISRAVQIALQYGIHHDSVQTQLTGSLARRVQCVHCKGITEDVKTDIYVCAHCHLNLFVRDHYSRRIGAFQGVCVDAESPGDVPEAREVYP